MGYLIGLVVILLVIGGVLSFLKQQQGEGGVGDDRVLPYRKNKYLLTKAEASFYHHLTKCVAGQYVVFVKVRLIDLIGVKKGAEQYAKFRNYIINKHIDFVLCTLDTLEPRLLIELDDKSHEREDRQKRDKFVDRACAAAEVEIMHVPVKRSYEMEEIRDYLVKAAGGA